MRILVVGSGGREHALAWKIAQSPKTTKVYCAPGNGGTRLVAENIPIPDTDIPRLADFYARQLHDHGIRSIRQLAELSEAEVRAMLNIPAYHSPNIDGWLRAARKLTRKGRNERASGR